MKYLVVLVSSLMSLSLVQRAEATSFTSFDPRSMAMGGSGVATAKAYNATLFNPALLLDPRGSESSTFFRPYAGARFIDRDNFVGAIDDFQEADNIQAVENAIGAFESRFSIELNTSSDVEETLSLATGLSNSVELLVQDYENLSDKPLRVAGALGITLGQSRQQNAWAITARHQRVGGGVVRESAGDIAFLQETVQLINGYTDSIALLLDENSIEQISQVAADFLDQTDFGDIGDTDLTDDIQTQYLEALGELPSDVANALQFIATSSDLPINSSAEMEQQDISSEALGKYIEAIELLAEGDTIGLTSLFAENLDFQELPKISDYAASVEFEGAEINELALSYAFRTDQDSGWSWGLSLKHLSFTTVHTLDQLIEVEIADFDNPEFQRKYSDINIDLGVAWQLTDQVRLGWVTRNIIPQDYLTVRENKVELRPLSRLGVAWENANLTLTSDIDLTTNDPLGFDPDKRYITAGAEWRVWRNTALRAGYRRNTVSGSELWSAGFGIGPKNKHLDLAVAGEGDELGVSIQFASFF